MTGPLSNEGHQQIARARAEVAAQMSRMLEYLMVRWAYVFQDYPPLLAAIERTRHDQLTVLLTNTLMKELGDVRPGTKEPRFDKTRRLLNRRNKRPRGVTRAQWESGDTYE